MALIIGNIAIQLMDEFYPETLLKTVIWRISFVSTKPGFTALTVTPVPLNFLANNRVNIMFANLL